MKGCGDTSRIGVAKPSACVSSRGETRALERAANILRRGESHHRPHAQPSVPSFFRQPKLVPRPRRKTFQKNREQPHAIQAAALTACGCAPPALEVAHIFREESAHNFS